MIIDVAVFVTSSITNGALVGFICFQCFAHLPLLLAPHGACVLTPGAKAGEAAEHTPNGVPHPTFGVFPQ